MFMVIHSFEFIVGAITYLMKTLLLFWSLISDYVDLITNRKAGKEDNLPIFFSFMKSS